MNIGIYYDNYGMIIRTYIYQLSGKGVVGYPLIVIFSQNKNIRQGRKPGKGMVIYL